MLRLAFLLRQRLHGAKSLMAVEAAAASSLNCSRMNAAPVPGPFRKVGHGGHTRLFVYGSASFLSDDALSLVSSLDRTEYEAPLVLVENTIDWTLEDRGLRAIRSQ